MLLNIGIAILLDLLIGDPPNWPHPVRFIGLVIAKLEKWVRAHVKQLYIGGFYLLIATIVTIIMPIVLVNAIIPPFFRNMLNVYLLYTCLATRCLADEAMKVKCLLDEGNIGKARTQLSYLVGRDTADLSRAEVTRGVVETVSENTVDGVLAPLFYMICGAPFGLSMYFALLYKIVNTLDSMVGYKQAPFTEIGYASAKFDDFLNFIPARLGAILMIFSGGLAGKKFRSGLRIYLRDRKKHLSPNSGHPESAVAGLLGIQIGGSNQYFGVSVNKPTIGDAEVQLSPEHITDSAVIMVISEIMMFALALLCYGVLGINLL